MFRKIVLAVSAPGPKISSSASVTGLGECLS